MKVTMLMIVAAIIAIVANLHRPAYTIHADRMPVYSVEGWIYEELPCQ
jgi:Tfp pilus assembly protein PilE